MRNDARVYIWDDPLLSRRGADHIIRRCVPEDEQGGIIDKWHAHYHMKDTLQEIEQPRKFSNEVFTGLPYSETVVNGLSNVIYVRG